MCPLSVSLFSWCRCKVCPLTFFSKSDMQIHSKTHTEAKAHKCPHCTKSFANASYLAQHLRIHLGVKPYRCSYCEKCFRQLSHLQQHTRSDVPIIYSVIVSFFVCDFIVMNNMLWQSEVFKFFFLNLNSRVQELYRLKYFVNSWAQAVGFLEITWISSHKLQEKMEKEKSFFHFPLLVSAAPKQFFVVWCNNPQDST